MKKLNKFFYPFAVIALIAVGFPAVVSANCGCSCSPIMSQLGAGSMGARAATPACSQATQDVALPEQTSDDACQKACAALPAPGGVGTPPCYHSSGQGTCGSGSTVSCWCDAGSGAYKKSETASQTDCQKTCTDMSQKFVAWSNAGPALPGSDNSIKCPPGGDWTSTTCAEAKNSDGVKIGRWDDKTGKCFYNDVPIKLGVGLGALTQANLAQYLSAAYNLALGFAAVLAVIFIMIGGFRYLSAAGGAGVEEGKSMIKNAVVGLILSALSYTLLLTVNPDILSLRLPSIQLIKACDIKPVDCGSMKKEDCEKADPALKCSWDIKGSMCLSLAATQSGTPGQLGGECKHGFTCSDGQECIIGTPADGNKCHDGTDCKDSGKSCSVGECVDIGGGQSRCSQFGRCQACQNDTTYNSSGEIDANAKQQCQPNGGYPVKCIDNLCADINSNNPPKSGSTPSKDNYILCTGTSGCTDDSQCGTGKCGSNHICQVSNQGTTGCTSDGDCKTKENFKCVKQQTSGGWMSACCLNGDPNGCLGCSSDSACSTGTFCLTQGRLALAKSAAPLDDSSVSKCINSLSSGAPCDGDKMCQSARCASGSCSSIRQIYPCDAETIKPLMDKNIIKNADEFCIKYVGGAGLGPKFYCDSYGKCSDGTPTYSP